MEAETAPLLPGPRAAQLPVDSHPIYLRACHSPWKFIDQRILTFIRLIISGYLTSVFGVSLKYKLETLDQHTNWRIPFQFSTVTFTILWAYNLQVTTWTVMHLLSPRAAEVNEEECHGHQLRTKFIKFLSPPTQASCPNRRFAFSLFYTTAHVFTFMNTIIYWAILVPAGHGGFKTPKLPHHDHGNNGNSTAMYDPNGSMFEDDIKAFSIINVWSITSVIAFLEVLVFNSIRRPTPVAGHVVGTMFASGAYLAWAGLGKLITGHFGLFFLDPELMGGMKGATVAASAAFVTFSPGIFSYLYGLIAMRETMSAHHDTH